MNPISLHPAYTPVSTFPVISFSSALLKVAHENYRTLGKRNADDKLDVFLCLPDGTPLAIVDLEGSRSEVRNG